jgi:SH3-like domain-containing protein
MKPSILCLTLSVVLASPLVPGTLSVARAESVEARQSAEVLASPGEQARVVTRVRAGTEMTVLQRSGRWLKVRVNGRTGWLPRSVIAAAERGERVTRRRPFVEGRSSRRGARSAPRDRVGADVVDGEEGFIDEDEPPKSRKPSKSSTKKPRRDDDRRARADDRDDDEDDGDEDLDAAGDDEDEGDEEEAAVKRPKVRVVVVSAAALRSRPSKKAKELDAMAEGTRVMVLEEDGDWLRVKREDGDEGWVRSGEVGDAPAYRYAKMGWRASAGLGYASLSQSFSSNSAATLGNYDVSAGAFALAVGGEVIYDYSADYLIAGDLGYRYGIATPGIRFVDGDQAVDTGYKTHDLDVGAAFGYKLHRQTGMAVYGRLGYHYGMFQVDNVSDFAANPAKLPTENLQGLTVGAYLDVPRLAARWAVRGGIDTMPVLASRTQTVGLEDGAVSDTFGLSASLRGIYDWREKLKASAQLSYVYSETKWTGAAAGSMRDHAVDSNQAVRTDGSFVLLLALSRPF